MGDAKARPLARIPQRPHGRLARTCGRGVTVNRNRSMPTGSAQLDKPSSERRIGIWLRLAAKGSRATAWQLSS
jgi:hypothetical protein